MDTCQLVYAELHACLSRMPVVVVCFGCTRLSNPSHISLRAQGFRSGFLSYLLTGCSSYSSFRRCELHPNLLSSRCRLVQHAPFDKLHWGRRGVSARGAFFCILVGHVVLTGCAGVCVATAGVAFGAKRLGGLGDL